MSTELQSGVPVVFVGGKYKNQNLRGTVERLTAKQVYIVIGNGPNRNQRVRVNQTSVAVVTENRGPVSQARGDASSRPRAARSSPRVSNQRVEPLRRLATQSSRPRAVSPSPQSRSVDSLEDYVFVDASDGQSLISALTADDVGVFVDANDIESTTDAGDHSATTFIKTEDQFVDALTSSDEGIFNSYVDVQSQADESIFEDAVGNGQIDTVTNLEQECEVDVEMAIVSDEDEPFEDAMDDMDETMVTAPDLATRVQTRSMTWRQTHLDVFSPLCVAGLNIDFLRLLLPGQKTHKHRTFGYHLFGDRLLTFEFNTASIPSNMILPISFGWQGRQYEILSSKLHREKLHKLSGPSMRITVQYVAVTDTHILENELNKIADFGPLTPRKAASRLELFESPAAMDNRKGRHCLLFDDLTTSDIEYFEGHSECGYVPKGTITGFLGTHAIGKRTDAFQVRLFSPKLGVFKGMLVEKPGISKIRLPSGMRKVGPSSVAGEDDDWACLVITMRHPSDKNVKMEQLLRVLNSNTSIKLPKWFLEDTKKPLSDMLTRLLENLGVPRGVWKQYYSDYATDESRTKLQHTFVVGVADPTGCLPEGHVFVPGLLKNGVYREQLFVTRFPCMERKDGRVLPVVTSKPCRMTDKQWSDLMSRDVGTIIFADSGPGKRALPELIATGDLDGDLYCVCWNETILSNIRHAEPVHLNQPAGLAAAERERTGRASMATPQPGWLRQTQHHVADLRTMMDHSKLFAKLHSLSIKEADKSNEDMNDPDVIQFGRAYKQALDIGKHGGKVVLPLRLWGMIPEKLHKYLEDGEAE